MTKEEHARIEDEIVNCIDEKGMTKEEMLQYVLTHYKASPILILNIYDEMYGD